mgnify:FL=1
MIVYDTKGGAQPKAAEKFIEDAWSFLSKQDSTEGCNVTITIEDLTLVAYDNAQFMQSLLDAVKAYKEDID